MTILVVTMLTLGASGQNFPYLDDALTNLPPPNPNAFPIYNLGFPRVGLAEGVDFNHGVDLPLEAFSKHDMLASKGGGLSKLRQINLAHTNILIVRYFSPRAFQAYSGYVNISMPFTTTADLTDDNGKMFAGHWMQHIGTTLSSAVGSNDLSLVVSNGTLIKNNMTGTAFDKTDTDGTRGTYLLIYDPPFDGSFYNAEFVFMTNLSGNVVTLQSGKRGFKSVKRDHPAGARVVELVSGAGDAAQLWSYNHSTLAPLDAAGRSLSVCMADWMRDYISYYNNTIAIAPNQPGGAGILYDADNWSLSGGNLDFNTDGVEDYNYDAAGFAPWGEGLDIFFALVRSNFPNKIIVGGGWLTRGWNSNNGTQEEDRVPNFNERFDEVLSRYTYRLHRHQSGPAYTDLLMRYSTALYTHGDGTPPANNKAFRNSFGLALLDDGFFSQGAHTDDPIPVTQKMDLWWDEFAVNLDPASTNYGHAVVSNPEDETEIRAHHHWMGRPLGPRVRLYAAASFVATNSLLYSKNGNFELALSGGNAWIGTGATLSRDASPGNFFEGNAALKCVVNSATASAKSPALTLTAGVRYTLSFAAKAQETREINVGLTGHSHNIQVGPEWTRYVLTVTNAGGNANVVFTLDDERQTVWIDDVYLFPSEANFHYREFENAAVYVNGSRTTKSATFNRWMRHIMGTALQRGTDATDPNDGAVLPPGSTVTVPSYDSLLLIKVPQVTLMAVSNASEIGPVAGSFTLSRDTGTNFPLTVYFMLSGTASNGLDYASVSDSVTIPPAATQATIMIRPQIDWTLEGAETVSIELLTNAVYALDPNGMSSAVLNIADNPARDGVARIRGFSYTPGSGYQMSVDWPGSISRGYCIEGSSNLVAWTPLTNLAVQDAPFLFTDGAASARPSYFYRLLGLSPNATNTCLSTAAEDGFVNSNNYVDSTNTGPNALRAGQNSSGYQLKSFLSFRPPVLPMDAVVLGAKLRLKRAGTTGTPYVSLGACQVDIKSGGFNGNTVLEAADFSAPADASNVTQVPDASIGTWAEAPLDLTTYPLLNGSSPVQLRVYFTGTNATNVFAGWNSGDTPGSEPQLLIEYAH